MHQNPNQHFLETSILEFEKYKAMADKAIERLDANELHYIPNQASNSVAIIMKHMKGNMISRWTDFLTSDGEKPDRDRDTEFEEGKETKEELMAIWEKGWTVFFNTLHSLKPEDMMATVYIRKEPHTAMKAFIRQLTHYAYHVGQIVFLAKLIKDNHWDSLSIPKGKSAEFLNKTPERPF